MLQTKSTQLKVFEGQNFTLDVPDHWRITSTPGGQTLFAEPREIPAPAISVAVTVRAARDANTIHKVALVTIENHQANYPDYRVIANKSVTVSGRPAQLLRYRWFNGKFNTDVYQSQLLILDEGLLYAVTI